jgi:HEAT repeat protein
VKTRTSLFKPFARLLLPGLLLTGLAFSQAPQADTKTRLRNVRDLAKMGQDAIPQIAPYVADPDIGVRVEAVKALVDIGGPKTVDPLVRAAGDTDPEIQIRATDGLVNVYLPGYIKTGLSGSIQRVGNTVKSKFSDTNDQIIDAFVQVRPDVIEALGKLARSGGSVDARANAARALGILRGRAAIPDLADAMHSKDDLVMYESLIAIQKIRDPAAAPRVTFLLRDLNERIQVTALETTGLLRNQEAAPDVRDALEHARSIKVRRAALSALAMLGEPADRPTFTRYLNDKDDALRASAAEGLGRLNDPSDRSPLDKAFTDEHKMNSRLADAFAIVLLGNVDLGEFSPLRYLINTLNVRAYRDVAVAYLVELARDPKIRQALYTALPSATKDEKIQLSLVLSRSGDRDSVQYLQTLSMDPDKDVAAEGLRGLRTLQARLP